MKSHNIGEVETKPPKTRTGSAFIIGNFNTHGLFKKAEQMGLFESCQRNKVVAFGMENPYFWMQWIAELKNRIDHSNTYKF